MPTSPDECRRDAAGRPAAYWDDKAAEAAENAEQARAADALAEVLLADLDASYCRARAEQVRRPTS